MAQVSSEKLEYTVPAEKERIPSVPQRERAVGSWQVLWSRPCQKVKEQSRLSRARDGEGKRVKVGESRSLTRKKRSEWENGEKWMDSTVIDYRFHGGKRRASKKSLLRESRRKHERVNGHKSSPGRSEESWFHSMFGQT